ncbi:hypothetical protein [Aphanizomenon flos-aquae]|uniref:hypothetical protein n=1 Tax=Aphanizomenon flos-aquae TaxID=1176 RepID=UPI00048093B1|nr:hypothetical protein [Aphanizomenon flos-aquae]
MNNPKKTDFQQPPEKSKGIFGWFQGDKPQISSIRIGMWGTVSSGKTIYLARLCELLSEGGKFRVQPGSDKAKKFVEHLLKNMNNETKDGILPLPTFYQPGESNVEILTYKLEPLSSEFGSATIILEFIDAPGEFFQNPDATLIINNADKSSSYTNIIDYLMSCHGIIFLLDPLRKDDANDDYFGLLLDLFTTFQIRSYPPELPKVPILEQYMAFCVTKVDQNDELLKTPTMDLVKDVMGLKMWACLQNNFSSVELDFNKRQKPNKNNRCNFYSTSAFGRFKNEQGQAEKFLQYPSIPKADIPNDLNDIPNNETWKWEEEYIPNNQPPINNSAPDRRRTLEDIGQEIEVDNQPKLIVKQRKEGCNPSNIIEPLEWLIKSIIKHPPTLPTSSSQSSNFSQNHN